MVNSKVKARETKESEMQGEEYLNCKACGEVNIARKMFGNYCWHCASFADLDDECDDCGEPQEDGDHAECMV